MVEFMKICEIFVKKFAKKYKKFVQFVEDCVIIYKIVILC